MPLICTLHPSESALGFKVRKLPVLQRYVSRAGMREWDLASGLRSFAAEGSCSLFLGLARLTPAQSRTEASKRRFLHFSSYFLLPPAHNSPGKHLRCDRSLLVRYCRSSRNNSDLVVFYRIAYRLSSLSPSLSFLGDNSHSEHRFRKYGICNE